MQYTNVYSKKDKWVQFWTFGEHTKKYGLRL